MNASIVQAQKTLGEPENAFLTGKNALTHGSQKRGGMLPSLEKERCLSCNSAIRDPNANASAGGVVNKNPHQMTPVFGGGFALGSPAPGDKAAARGNGSTSNNNNNSHNHSAPYLPSSLAASSSSTRIATLSDSASEGYACVWGGVLSLAESAHAVRQTALA